MPRIAIIVIAIAIAALTACAATVILGQTAAPLPQSGAISCSTGYACISSTSPSFCATPSTCNQNNNFCPTSHYCQAVAAPAAAASITSCASGLACLGGGYAYCSSDCSVGNTGICATGALCMPVPTNPPPAAPVQPGVVDSCSSGWACVGAGWAYCRLNGDCSDTRCPTGAWCLNVPTKPPPVTAPAPAAVGAISSCSSGYACIGDGYAFCSRNDCSDNGCPGKATCQSVATNRPSAAPAAAAIQSCSSRLACIGGGYAYCTGTCADCGSTTCVAVAGPGFAAPNPTPDPSIVSMSTIISVVVPCVTVVLVAVVLVCCLKRNGGANSNNYNRHALESSLNGPEP